jgi:alpha-D-ribose 1-methylphosphonate 5-triphosphate synthase subunit PhnH
MADGVSSGGVDSGFGGALSGGFADPPIDAAHAFRAALDAMARPGTVRRVAGVAPPAPLSVAAGALALALCDAAAPLHLAGDLDAPAVREWLLFHAGVSLVGRSPAQFAIGTWDALIPLEDYPAGTPEFPDRSATLIVEMPALDAASGARLTGPGIDGAARLALPDAPALAANAARYPLGLDLFFTAGDRLAALPRSTCVEAG